MSLNEVKFIFMNNNNVYVYLVSRHSKDAEVQENHNECNNHNDNQPHPKLCVK